MKKFTYAFPIALQLLIAGETIAQREVVLPGVCATCPTSTTPNIFGETVPCEGLTNIRDISGSQEYNIDMFRTTGFISQDGTVYTGWNSFQGSLSSGFDRLMTGRYLDIPGVKNHSTNIDNFSAFPAISLWYYASGQTFKAIQRNESSFFVLSDQGKIYTWGNAANQSTGKMYPITGQDTTVFNNTLSVYRAKPKEIKHPEGRAWKAMKVYNSQGYAADDQGKWWCWGQAMKHHMPSMSFSLPAAGVSYGQNADSYARTYIPVRMDRLKVQPIIPASDDQCVLVSKSSALGSDPYTLMPALAYIGADSSVYVYKYIIVKQTNGELFVQRDTTMKINLPGGKAIKLQRVNMEQPTDSRKDIFCVLSTNGKIYYFWEDGTIAQMTNDQYFFVDFVTTRIPGSYGFTEPIERLKPSFFGVPRNRDKLIYGAINLSSPNYSYGYAELAEDYGVPAKVGKIWAHGNTPTYVLVKSAETGHTYVSCGENIDFSKQPYRLYGGGFDISTPAKESYIRAIGGQLGGNTINDPFNATSTTGLPATGFFKLINCSAIR
ncbi:hypothetical protein [Arsenicibacter rosenii]|uniref:Uncharacterized protein n=1 Tax=Arsenicibacter rosenii TaxID=1750698 RepID=A0A1S2VK31_9BACT|nr:hypothetical protein [Arsenicibacter rosenii]OIN58750.1 hypothetical protein BLX24_14445 [Arsenicibacter rosenii]